MTSITSNTPIVDAFYTMEHMLTERFQWGLTIGFVLGSALTALVFSWA